MHAHLQVVQRRVGAAFVLLIGGVNVANLVLVRTTLRRKEFATRLALGAGTGRLMRHLVTESVIVALSGGAAGAVLGTGLLRALVHRGIDTLPRAGEVHVDGMVVLAMLVNRGPGRNRHRLDPLGAGDAGAGQRSAPRREPIRARAGGGLAVCARSW